MWRITSSRCPGELAGRVLSSRPTNIGCVSGSTATTCSIRDSPRVESVATAMLTSASGWSTLSFTRCSPAGSRSRSGVSTWTDSGARMLALRCSARQVTIASNSAPFLTQRGQWTESSAEACSSRYARAISRWAWSLPLRMVRVPGPDPKRRSGRATVSSSIRGTFPRYAKNCRPSATSSPPKSASHGRVISRWMSGGTATLRAPPRATISSRVSPGPTGNAAAQRMVTLRKRSPADLARPHRGAGISTSTAALGMTHAQSVRNQRRRGARMAPASSRARQRPSPRVSAARSLSWSSSGSWPSSVTITSTLL